MKENRRSSNAASSKHVSACRSPYKLGWSFPGYAKPWVHSNDGRNHYVMNETIDWDRNGGDGFIVQTKMVQSENVTIITWSFRVDGRFSNSLNEGGNINGHYPTAAPARSIYRYCLNYIHTHS